MTYLDLDPFDPQQAEDAELKIRKEYESADDRIRKFLERRRQAYIRVFLRGTPEESDRKIVLDDLVAFTRGDVSAYHPDERTHVLLTGRQEVWLRIKDHTRLTLDALMEKYVPPEGKRE